jgi:hypothetical protein
MSLLLSAMELITLPPSVSRLSRRCGSLNLSHPYGPSRPVTGIALLLLTAFSFMCILKAVVKSVDGFLSS